VGDIALWVVPAGIIGGRIYFDITTPDGHPARLVRGVRGLVRRPRHLGRRRCSAAWSASGGCAGAA
jgi:hypothetical protein